jgi:hypothetical protein
MAVEEGVMGTTTIAVEDAAAAAEEVILNVILDAGMAGGVERVSVVRPSRGFLVLEVRTLQLGAVAEARLALLLRNQKGSLEDAEVAVVVGTRVEVEVIASATLEVGTPIALEA